MRKKRTSRKNVATETVVYGEHEEYEWDPQKAAANLKKHGVTFEEATTAFDDDRAMTLKDPHEDDERFVVIGMSNAARVLYVVHAERESVTRTRIISARLAEKREALRYAAGGEAL